MNDDDDLTAGGEALLLLGYLGVAVGILLVAGACTVWAGLKGYLR